MSKAQHLPTSSPARNENILNEGLDFAMEFGPNWLKPIQSRLAAKHPELTPAELDDYDRVCREAMNFGHNETIAAWKKAPNDEDRRRKIFDESVLARYLWISKSNLAHLYSQGMYYGWKDGEIIIQSKVPKTLLTLVIIMIFIVTFVGLKRAFQL